MAHDEKLERLKKKQEQIKAQIAGLEAKQRDQKRKDETRLKIIVGAALLQDASLNPQTAVFLAELLERAIKSERDRALLQAFGYLKKSE